MFCAVDLARLKVLARAAPARCLLVLPPLLDILRALEPIQQVCAQSAVKVELQAGQDLDQDRDRFTGRGIVGRVSFPGRRCDARLDPGSRSLRCAS